MVSLSTPKTKLKIDWKDWKEASNNFKIKIFQPQNEISNNVVCATSKASDQPAHTRSLIITFASRLHIL